MEYVELLDFFAVYSLPTLIIAVIVAVVKLVTDRFLASKIGALFSGAIPLALAVLLNFGYDCVFIRKGVYFGEETFTTGLLAWSIASIITAIVYRIKTGKLNGISDSVGLIIEGILRNHVRADFLISTAVAVKGFIEKALKTENYDHDALVNEIAEKVKEFSEDGITDDEIKAVAELTVKAVKQLKNK